MSKEREFLSVNSTVYVKQGTFAEKPVTGSDWKIAIGNDMNGEERTKELLWLIDFIKSFEENLHAGSTAHVRVNFEDKEVKKYDL